MALAPGTAAPLLPTFRMRIREFKKIDRGLREEQNESRVDELKLVIAALRQRITDEKLDEF